MSWNTRWPSSAAAPPGLACAIRLKQLESGSEHLRAGKGRQPGRAFPVGRRASSRGRSMSCCRTGASHPPAICVPAARDEFLFMTRAQALSPAHSAADGESRQFHHFARAAGARFWGRKPRSWESMCSPGFAAAEALFDEAGAVKGVRIGDMGVEKNGEPGPNFALGPEIHAKVTMFCEGCRGSVSKQLIQRFSLDAGKSPQTYGLGFKELWQLPPGRVRARPDSAHLGLAARLQHLRRQLSVSPRQRPGVRRIRGRAGLRRIRASSRSRPSSNTRITPTSKRC